MLRVAGAVILLTVAAWIGLTVKRAERNRIFLLTSSIALIRHARRKIELFETPTSDLFIDFSDGFDETTRCALTEKTLLSALEPIVKTLGDDGTVLQKFAREIGCGYKTDAIRLCDYCLAVMEERYTAAASRYSTHKKLYLVLPLLLAVSVIVLLL